ncbi:MAG: ATP-binding cassette domain-containing protein, partial [Planctomycetota bacterium]
MNTTTPLYQLINLKKNYGGSPVLNISSLQFQPGKIHILVGPNGSGKTTLLNILSFLDRPSQGQLLFKNQTVVHEDTNLYKLRRTITLVLQNHFLFSSTVFNNVAYGLKQRGLAASVIKQKVTESLALVNLKELADRPAQKLSGGESKRVAIARALILEPEVLCLDEPTVNIDRRNEESIENIIRLINQDTGTTVIMTTHDLNQAYRLGHQVFSLLNGKVVETSMENVFSGELKETDGL